MPRHSAAARRSLDARFQRLNTLQNQNRPHRGWIRAIRDALGMTGEELAARMGVTQSTVAEMERNEVQGTIRLDTLQRAADALWCDVAYFLMPRTSLDEAVRDQARRKAARHLGRVAHHSRLEDQELADDVAAAQLDRFAAELIDRRGLWTTDDQ